MAKFKVGDKVRILDGSKIENYTGGWSCFRSYGMDKYVGEVHIIKSVDEDWPGGRVSYFMEDIGCYRWDERGLEAAYKFKVGDKVIGNKKANCYGITREGWIGIVTRVNDDEILVKGPGVYGERGTPVDSKCFDLVPNDRQKIVITTDGKTTTAVLYDGKQRIKGAKAVCAYGDTFDFNYGASLALDRLTGFVRGSVDNTLEVKSQMDRFIAGEIALRVPEEKMDKFLAECEKRDLKWMNGKKPTEWAPDEGWYKVVRMFYNKGALQRDNHDVRGYTFEDWEETEEDVPDFYKSDGCSCGFCKIHKGRA